MAATDRDPEELGLSLVRGDALFRLQRAIGLVPAGSLGIGRRAIALVLFTWLPIAVWAALAHRALPAACPSPCSSTSACTCAASSPSRCSSWPKASATR